MDELDSRTKHTPPSRLEIAFDVGQLIAQFRWHCQGAVFSGNRIQELKSAKLCAVGIQAAVSELLPMARGGDLRTITKGLRESLVGIGTNGFTEDLNHALSLMRFSVDPDIDSVVDSLQSYVPTIGDQLEAVLTELFEADAQLCQALHLGICLEEGIFPRVTGHLFLDSIQNPDWMLWQKKWSQSQLASKTLSKGHKKRWRSLKAPASAEKPPKPPEHLVIQRHFRPGEISPDLAWFQEARNLVRSLCGDVSETVSPLMSALSANERRDVVDMLKSTVNARLHSIKHRRFAELAVSNHEERQQAEALIPRSSSPLMEDDASRAASTSCGNVDNKTPVAITSVSPMGQLESDQLSTNADDWGVTDDVQTPIDIPVSNSPTAPRFNETSEVSGVDHSIGREQLLVNEKNCTVEYRGVPRSFKKSLCRLLSILLSRHSARTTIEICYRYYGESKTRPVNKQADSLRSKVSELNRQLKSAFGLNTKHFPVHRDESAGQGLDARWVVSMHFDSETPNAQTGRASDQQVLGDGRDAS